MSSKASSSSNMRVMVLSRPSWKGHLKARRKYALRCIKTMPWTLSVFAVMTEGSTSPVAELAFSSLLLPPPPPPPPLLLLLVRVLLRVLLLLVTSRRAFFLICRSSILPSAFFLTLRMMVTSLIISSHDKLL